MVRLSAALRKEQEKYQECPVRPDMMPDYETAQAWGYVITGYFLLEEFFKAILYLRGVPVPSKHSLTMLFDLFEPSDQDVLREYYSDYRATVGGYRANFPFLTLGDFLKNLDGDQNRKGTEYLGSFDWRYYLIEEHKSQSMPFISIDYLHEVAYGCDQIAHSIFYANFDPLKRTYTWRLRWARKEKYDQWLMVRGDPDGRCELSDRLEILWGPDYRSRYDLLLVKGQGMQLSLSFSEMPDHFPLPVIDKRKEIEAFNPIAGR